MTEKRVDESKRSTVKVIVAGVGGLVVGAAGSAGISAHGYGNRNDDSDH